MAAFIYTRTPPLKKKERKPLLPVEANGKLILRLADLPVSTLEALIRFERFGVEQSSFWQQMALQLASGGFDPATVPVGFEDFQWEGQSGMAAYDALYQSFKSIQKMDCVIDTQGLPPSLKEKVLSSLVEFWWEGKHPVKPLIVLDEDEYWKQCHFCDKAKISWGEYRQKF